MMNSKMRSPPIKPAAVGYMCISSFAFAAMYLLAKDLQSYGGFALVFFRALGTLILAAGYLLAQGISLRGNQPSWLLARGLSGAASLTLFFFALEHVPVTAAVAIRYLSPLIAVGIAAAMLSERVRWMQWVYFAIAFGGVLLLKGVDARITGYGLALILSSAVLGGITFAIIRKLGTSEHPLVIVTYFTGIATAIGAIGLLVNGDPWPQPSLVDGALLASLGIVGFVGQLYMTRAMQIEEASKVMPLKYLEAAILFVASYYLLDERYGGWAIVGLLCILAGNLLNSLTKRPS